MLDTATIEQFALALRGRLIQPGDPDYDEARSVWNGMIDRRPAMIAQCTGVADVITCVNFARDNAVPVTVRAGGHSVAGKSMCDNGLVIDLALMNGVRVDPVAKKAYVEAGAVGGDLDHETQAFGLATTGGTDSTTGVAGLTLGGGTGFLAPAFGLAVDNLLAADVVTVDGKLLHASQTENTDLLWALRGGGGNVGVVTSLEFQLHEVGPDVLVAQIFHPFEDSGDVLRFYREFTATAPDEVFALAAFMHVPPVEPFPEEFHGKTAIALVVSYAGSVEDGEAVMAPLQSFGNPILNAVMPMPYVTLQQTFDAANPAGGRYYWKSQYLPELSDDAIATMVSKVEPFPGPMSIVFMEPMGGAIQRVDATATAFPHRNVAFNFSISGAGMDPAQDAEIIAWVREFHAAMTPYATGGVYANYLDHDDTERVRAAYGVNYERLQQIKTKYDPNNLFNANQRTDPSASIDRQHTKV
jgi:FAD/FMN-containing dehydrogenase